MDEAIRQPPVMEYDSPFPECRVTAAAEPVGMVRLDVSRNMAAVLAKRFHETAESHDEGLVDLVFILPHRAYQQLSDNVGRILTTDADAIQVVASDDPAVSIAVLLNKSQIEGLDESTTHTLTNLPPQERYGWEVSVSENGVAMLVQQLVAAVKGAEEPTEHIDLE